MTLRDNFVNIIFSKEKIFDLEIIPLMLLSVQLGDDFVRISKRDYSEILARSCYNIISKFFFDILSEYPGDNIELEILITVKKIPRTNTWINLMEMISQGIYEELNSTFVFFLLRELALKSMYNINPFILLLALKILQEKKKLSFVKYIREEKIITLSYLV